MYLDMEGSQLMSYLQRGKLRQQSAIDPLAYKIAKLTHIITKDVHSKIGHHRSHLKGPLLMPFSQIQKGPSTKYGGKHHLTPADFTEFKFSYSLNRPHNQEVLREQY